MKGFDISFDGSDIELGKLYMIGRITLCYITHSIDRYKIKIAPNRSLCLQSSCKRLLCKRFKIGQREESDLVLQIEALGKWRILPIHPHTVIVTQIEYDIKIAHTQMKLLQLHRQPYSLADLTLYDRPHYRVAKSRKKYYICNTRQYCKSAYKNFHKLHLISSSFVLNILFIIIHSSFQHRYFINFIQIGSTLFIKFI